MGRWAAYPFFSVHAGVAGVHLRLASGFEGGERVRIFRVTWTGISGARAARISGYVLNRKLATDGLLDAPFTRVFV